MAVNDLRQEVRSLDIGSKMYEMVRGLYPICRSITGDGVRETLGQIAARLPDLEMLEVSTGTAVLDWSIPREWSVRDAYIADLNGVRLVDFQKSNLHLLNYSSPFRGLLNGSELLSHLFTLADRPNLIPYRTSYYSDNWGFCVPHDWLTKFRDDEVYEVVIDTELRSDGSLTYGELLVSGSCSDEVLVSCHVCHPSLCNDNLSGIAVAAALAGLLMKVAHRLSYRFVFVPGTIGSIAWLARNRERASLVRHGLVLTGVGDRGAPTYKRSRRGDADIDRAAAHVLALGGRAHEIRDFSPWGYDERQYCSPGFDLPVGCLMRTPHGEYPEYHTSADDLDFVTAESMTDTLEICLAMFDVIERNGVYRNLNPYGEPQLGRRGIYGAIGGSSDKRADELALLWVLNMSDGSRSLLDVAERSKLPFDVVARAAQVLTEHELLAQVEVSG